MTALLPRPSTVLVIVALLVAAPGFATSSETAPPTATASSFYPMQQMYFLKKIKPDVERVGVLWKKGVKNQEEKLQALRRATTSIQTTLYLAYVEQKSDIGNQFRELTRSHDVDVIWIVENDGIVDAATPKQFLIESALKRGIPLLAPTEDWVNAGAPVAVAKNGEDFQIVLNKPAAAATSLDVPAEYESLTKLVAAK